MVSGNTQGEVPGFVKIEIKPVEHENADCLYGVKFQIPKKLVVPGESQPIVSSEIVLNPQTSIYIQKTVYKFSDKDFFSSHNIQFQKSVSLQLGKDLWIIGFKLYKVKKDETPVLDTFHLTPTTIKIIINKLIANHVVKILFSKDYFPVNGLRMFCTVYGKGEKSGLDGIHGEVPKQIARREPGKKCLSDKVDIYIKEEQDNQLKKPGFEHEKQNSSKNNSFENINISGNWNTGKISIEQIKREYVLVFKDDDSKPHVDNLMGILKECGFNLYITKKFEDIFSLCVKLCPGVLLIVNGSRHYHELVMDFIGNDQDRTMQTMPLFLGDYPGESTTIHYPFPLNLFLPLNISPEHFLVEISRRIAGMLYTRLVSKRDMLTGLENHTSFNMHIDKLISTGGENGVNFSVALIDIRYCSLLNDTYGYQTVDQLVKILANHVKNSVNLSINICRYGYNQIAIIFPGCEIKKAVTLTNIIRDRVCEQDIPLNDPGRNVVNVAINAGVVAYPSQAQSRAGLIEKIESYLEKAKSGGENYVYPDVNTVDSIKVSFTNN